MKKKLLLAASSFAIAALFGFLLSVVVSEFSFYLLKGHWYFSTASQTRPPQEKVPGMALYRESFPIEKQGRRRILTIGGSTTYGFGVALPATWPKLLAKKLEEKYPGKYEVINVGRLGGHLEEFIQHFDHSTDIYISRDRWIAGVRPEEKDIATWGWKDLEPDFILLAPIVNDTAPDFIYSMRPNFVANLSAKLLAITEHSPSFNKLALGYYLKKGLLIVQQQNIVEGKKENLLKNIHDNYQLNLEAFIRLWRPTTKIYLLGLPLLFNENDNIREAHLAASFWNMPDDDSILKEVEYLPRIAKLEAGVRDTVSLNLSIPHKEIGVKINQMAFSKRLPLYLDSVHMNTRGVQIVADEIFEFLDAELNS